MRGSNFQYEVYVLNEEGYYANEDRSDNPLDELIFDYQRNLDEWTLVHYDCCNISMHVKGRVMSKS